MKTRARIGFAMLFAPIFAFLGVLFFSHPLQGLAVVGMVLYVAVAAYLIAWDGGNIR